MFGRLTAQLKLWISKVVATQFDLAMIGMYDRFDEIEAKLDLLENLGRKFDALEFEVKDRLDTEQIAVAAISESLETMEDDMSRAASDEVESAMDGFDFVSHLRSIGYTAEVADLAVGEIARKLRDD